MAAAAGSFGWMQSQLECSDTQCQADGGEVIGNRIFRTVIGNIRAIEAQGVGQMWGEVRICRKKNLCPGGVTFRHVARQAGKAWVGAQRRRRWGDRASLGRSPGFRCRWKSFGAPSTGFRRRSKSFGRFSKAFRLRSKGFGRRSKGFGRRSKGFGRHSKGFGLPWKSG